MKNNSFYDSQVGQLLMQVALQGHILEKKIVKGKKTSDYLEFLTKSYGLCSELEKELNKLEKEYVK